MERYEKAWDCWFLIWQYTIDWWTQQTETISVESRMCWPTKGCWQRLCTTLIRMAVTDPHRLYRNHDFNTYEHMGGTKFSDHICLGLQERSRQILPRALTKNEYGFDKLVRIKNNYGQTNKMITHKMNHRCNVVGPVVQQSCWMCRLNAGNGGKGKYKRTAFCCGCCKTPLCKLKEPRAGRQFTCLQEHFMSGDSWIRFNDTKKPKLGKKLSFFMCCEVWL